MIYTIPPHKHPICPTCYGQPYRNSRLAVSLLEDGTTVIDSDPGTPCYTCKGKGVVKSIDITPLGDDESD